MPAPDLAPMLDLDLPYPGLRPFEADEAFLFYGRRGHTDELLRRLATNRFLAVVGTSGSGKSSLVRAGLLPALYRGFLAGATSQWRIAVMKPGDAPMANLAKALRDRGVPVDELSRSSLGLVQAVNKAGFVPGEGLLIVADQFEELFRFRQEHTDGGAEANLFVMSLLEAADSFSAPIYVVLTMRADFLGDCTQFPGLAEALNRSQYLIPRLTREQRREAIEKPARLVDAAMAPRLVQRLLNELGDDPYQLPVLQHALNRTFRKWKGAAGEIDFEHYEAAKTLEGALNDHADALLRELPEAAQPWVEKLFRCLTTTLSGGRPVRRAARLNRIYDVLAITDDGSRALVRSVIEKYAQRENSLLVCSPPGEIRPESVIDITHESLISRWTKLKRWVEEEAEAVRWYGSAAEDALRHRRGQAGTWRDPELGRALALAENGPWNEAWARLNLPDLGIGYQDVRGFLDRGADEQRAIKRRVRVVWIGSIALLAAALTAVTAFWWERGREIEAQHGMIELQRRVHVLDNEVAAKEVEKSAYQERLRQAGLSASERAELQRRLDTATVDLKKLGEQRTRAELLEADLKKAQQDRDALMQQLDSAPSKETTVPLAEHQKALAKIASLEEELRKTKAPPNSVALRVGTFAQTRTGKDGLTYVWIPPGQFMMGCSPDDKECDPSEKPQHPVNVTHGFWLGQTEVTVAAYARFSKKPIGRQNPDFPITGVTWFEAKSYCEWAGLRLPTEAEWEYAARAGTTGATYGPLNDVAWYRANSGELYHAVRGKLPNAWELYDMLGNVWEWVADWYDAKYYQQSPNTDPLGPSTGEDRVVRGGVWASVPRAVRASERAYNDPSGQGYSFGFRCAGQ